MGVSEGTTTTASSSSQNNAGGAGPAGQEMRGWALVSRGDKVLRAAKKQLRIKRDAKKKAMKKNAKLEKKNSSSSSLQQMVDVPAKGGAVSIAALPPPKMGHSGGRRARGSGGQDRRAPAGSSHSDKSSSSSSSALDKNCAHWRFAVLDPMNDCIVFYKMEDLDDADNEVVQTFLLSDKKLAFVQVDEEVPADAQGPGAAAVSTATSAAAGGTRRKKAVVAPFHVVVRQKNSARVQLSFKTRAARDAWFRAIRDAHKISTGDSSLGDLVGQWQGEAQVCDDLKCFLPSSLPAEILDEESDDEDDDLSDDDSAEDSTSSDEVTGADAGEGAGDGGMRLRRGSSASSGLDRSLQRRTSMTQLAGSKKSSKKNEGKVVSRDELLSVSLEDSKRRRVEMSDIISARQPTVVVVLRHFGCVLCRRLVGTIVQSQRSFDALGVQLVAVGNGTPEQADAFKKEFAFRGRLLVDPQKKLYNALCCRRGVRVALSRKTLGAAKRAIGEGYRQGETTGDVLQLGGVFLMTRQRGLVWEHREQFAGDHPEVSSVIAKCANAISELDNFTLLPNRDIFPAPQRSASAVQSGKDGNTTDEYGLEMSGEKLQKGSIRKGKGKQRQSVQSATFSGAARHSSLIELAKQQSVSDLSMVDAAIEGWVDQDFAVAGTVPPPAAGWRMEVPTPGQDPNKKRPRPKLGYDALLRPVYAEDFAAYAHVNWIVRQPSKDGGKDSASQTGVVSLRLPCFVDDTTDVTGDCKMIIKLPTQIADTRLLVPDTVVTSFAQALRSGHAALKPSKILARAQDRIAKWMRGRLPILEPYSSWELVGVPPGFPIRSAKDREVMRDRHAAFSEAMVEWEQRSAVGTRFKFGLLYANKPSSDTASVTERDCYDVSARDIPENSPFWDLASLLGERSSLTELEGEYSGGLDTSQKLCTGKEVYSTKIQASVATDEGQPDSNVVIPVVWHTSPLLPDERDGDGADPSLPLSAAEAQARASAADEKLQQVQRKKHVGNDVVVAIYNDTGSPVDVDSFKTQFNHVFVIFSPVLGKRAARDDALHTRFEVCVVTKSSVPLDQTGPSLPTFDLPRFGVGECDLTAEARSLRRTILCKLANLEVAALLRAASFQARHKRVQKQGLEALVLRLSEPSDKKRSAATTQRAIIPNLDPTDQPLAVENISLRSDSGRTFGVPIENLLKAQAADFPGLTVPVILKKLLDALLRAGVAKCDGCFRHSPNALELNRARNILEGPVEGWDDVLLPTTSEGLHVLCGLLKLWLRELPESLVPTSEYDSAVGAADPAAAVRVVEELPQASRSVMRSLLGFLQVMARPEHVQDTRMGVENLAIVFSPGMLRCPSTDVLKLMSAPAAEAEFVRKLVEHLPVDVMKEMGEMAAPPPRVVQQPVAPVQQHQEIPHGNVGQTPESTPPPTPPTQQALTPMDLLHRISGLAAAGLADKSTMEQALRTIQILSENVFVPAPMN